MIPHAYDGPEPGNVVVCGIKVDDGGRGDQALEAATHAPGSIAAVAPTLTCVQSSLVAIAGAVDRLRGHALDRLTDPVLDAEDLRPLRADIALRLERLAGVLEQGSVVAGRTRDSMEPALSELTAI